EQQARTAAPRMDNSNALSFTHAPILSNDPTAEYTLWNRQTLGANFLLNRSPRQFACTWENASSEQTRMPATDQLVRTTPYSKSWFPSLTLPVALQKIPCSPRKNSLLRRIGIFPNNTLSTLVHRQSKGGAESRIRPNCLLISLLAGNATT